MSENPRFGHSRGIGIGIGIFLIALGAILAFAVDWSIGGLDLQAVGWILMVAGSIGLILFFSFWNQRRAPQPVAPVRERRVNDIPRTYDDPTPPPPTVTPQPQPPTAQMAVTPQWPPPAQAPAVSATAPVVASSRARPEGA